MRNLDDWKRLTSFLTGIACACSFFGVAKNAAARDGVLEINQTCAVETGCFAGDAAGLPVQISEGGAYRLTGNLTLAGEGSPVAVIEVSAPDVDLDLSGFAIRCAGSAGGSCNGTTRGVSGSANNVSVHDGTIADMPGSGIQLSGSNLRAERVHAINNGAAGLWLGGETTFLGSALYSGNVARDCLVASNAAEGIVVGSASFVRGNVVRANGGIGVTGRFTQTAPFVLSPTSGYLENVIQLNGGAVVSIIDMGSNLCADCP